MEEGGHGVEREAKEESKGRGKGKVLFLHFALEDVEELVHVGDI